MVFPRESGDGSHPARNPRTAALARRHLRGLLDGTSARSPRDHQPLVLVGDETAATLLDDIREACAARVPGGVVAVDGRDLDRAIAAAESDERFDRVRDRLVSPGVLLVHRVEAISLPRRQQRFARVLDDAASAGVIVCLSMARSPAAAGLDPALESRLSAGLVVPLQRSGPGRTSAVRPAVSVTDLIRATSRRQGIAVTSITGQCRTRVVVEARSLAMYLARRLTGSSLEAIGRAFGGREHTTVLRSVRSMARRLAADPCLAEDVESFVETLAIAASTRSRRRAGQNRRRRRVDDVSIA